MNGYRPLEIIGGYIAAYYTLATVQSLLVLGELNVLFKMQYSATTMLSIYFVIWLLALISIALGIFVSNFARTEGQVFPFIPLVILPSVFLSGIIIAVPQLPSWAQWLSRISPLYYANQVLQNLIVPPRALSWSGVGFLLVYGVAVLSLGTLTLRELD